MTYPSQPARVRLRARVAAWESEVCAQQVVLAALRLALPMRKAGFDPAEPRIPAGCEGGGRWAYGGRGGGISSKPELDRIAHPIGAVRGYPETERFTWRKANDDIFAEAARKFNGRNGYSPSDPQYVSPGFIKAWAMVESGGDRRAFATDPLQVNNPLNWAKEKREVTKLTGPHQIMTPETSTDAVLKWLQYKSTRPWGNAAAPYLGRRKALEFYNGSSNKKNYAERVLSLAKRSFGADK
jgi:hypothetical protein